MSPNGNFLYHSGINYAANSAKEVRAYAIDQNTGSLSLTAVYTNIPFSNAPLAIDPAVKYVYIAEQSDSTGANTLAGFTVDPTTGALTPLPTPSIPFTGSAESLAIVRPQ